ncbi:MAG TPA: hypothetical protein PLU30_12845 [Verrucomicrobiae bacterium]|nr:hypothetical protein [Verrucomicrobiae bacterium]
MKSSVLHISVTSGDDPTVNLDFTARLTDRLPNLMPTALRRRLDHRAVDLSSLASEARARDYAPGDILRFVEGAQVVHVWLE